MDSPARPPRVLDPAELTTALAGLPDWRARSGALHTAYAAPSASAALALVAEIGAAAEAADHHPDVDWRYDHVFVRTTTHQVGGEITERDTGLAGQISALAAVAGAAACPGLNRTIEIAVDTVDPQRVAHTWQTALGYRPSSTGDLIDPWGRGPQVWFQRTPTPAESRLHVDVHVDDEQAGGIVDALAGTAGPRLDATFAPAWWIVTDPDGNRICVCTQQQATEADEDSRG